MINVCFHGIGTPGRELEPGEDAYWVDESMFLRVLDEVVDRPDVRLSFDDGNASDVEVGLPALLDRGLRASFFVLAGRLDCPGSLSTHDVSGLVEHGMVVGSHGMDHRPWRAMDRVTRDRELVEARARLQDVTGTAVEEAALPLGRYDRRLLVDLRGLGYRRVHTSDRRRAADGAWLQPRYSLRRTDTLDSLHHEVLGTPSPLARLKGSAIGLVKRWR